MNNARQKPLLSVIVPLFNPMVFLPSLFSTLLEQTFTNFLVIFILKETNEFGRGDFIKLVPKNLKHRLILQPSQGVAQARKDGLDAVDTPFFTYLDADDSLDPRCFETVVPFMQSQSLDICLFPVIPTKYGFKEIPSVYRFSHSNRLIMPRDLVLFCNGIKPSQDLGPINPNAPYGRVYSNLMKQYLDFGPFPRGEDFYSSFKPYSFAKRVGLSDFPFYFYSYNVSGSLTKQLSYVDNYYCAEANYHRAAFYEAIKDKLCSSVCQIHCLKQLIGISHYWQKVVPFHADIVDLKKRISRLKIYIFSHPFLGTGILVLRFLLFVKYLFMKGKSR